VGSVGNTKGNWKDLDEFYASDGSEEEEDGAEEEEEEEQEEGQEESEQGSDSVSTQEGSQEMERSKHALLTGSQGQSTTQKLDDFYD
jgi:AP-3 complex subunit beta